MANPIDTYTSIIKVGNLNIDDLLGSLSQLYKARDFTIEELSDPECALNDALRNHVSCRKTMLENSIKFNEEEIKRIQSDIKYSEKQIKDYFSNI
jgi:hypothetical protein